MKLQGSPTSQGRAAENDVAAYLMSCGYSIIEQNWRTPYCEIDLIVRQADTVYMVEVKYRSNSYSGDGLDAITNTKMAQMKRAADAWVQIHNYIGLYQLMVAAVSPNDEIALITIDN